MLGLPKSTEMNKQLPKKAIYRFLNDMQELFFATEKLKKYIQGNPTINEREELLTAVQNIESGKISKSKTN